MKADRDSSEPQVDALEATCRRQAHEIQTLGETVSVFRKGAHSLSVENAPNKQFVAVTQLVLRQPFMNQGKVSDIEFRGDFLRDHAT